MKRWPILGGIFIAAALIALLLAACNRMPRVVGHYSYEHGWDYEIEEGHIYVQETGTMDFHADGSALDSARQNYFIVFSDGDSVGLVFNYISPSRWRMEGVDFYFAGTEEGFRMDLLEKDCRNLEKEAAAMEIADRTVKSVAGSISREIKFHLDTLTDKELIWSYTYPDGHTDTWEFYKD